MQIIEIVIYRLFLRKLEIYNIILTRQKNL